MMPPNGGAKVIATILKARPDDERPHLLITAPTDVAVG
jgi:hypothetical protein